MTPRRGRRVALWGLLAGVLILVAAGYECRSRIATEYWLWKLKRGDRPVGADVWGWFRQHIWLHDGPGIRVYFGRYRSHPFSDAEYRRMAEAAGRSPASEALAKIGGHSVPGLIAALDQGDKDVQIRAAWALGQIGADAVAAEAALTERQNCPNVSPVLKAAAAEALRRIRGEGQP